MAGSVTVSMVVVAVVASVVVAIVDDVVGCDGSVVCADLASFLISAADSPSSNSLDVKSLGGI